MKGLIRDGRLVRDPFVQANPGCPPPGAGALIVSLEQWAAHRGALAGHAAPLGVRLRSDQHPESIVPDLERFAVVALEFPVFRDGRPYSYARLLRERYRYRGELRAVGDVQLEQLHFMVRVGFDAFEVASDDPLGDFRCAQREFSVWYQPAADARPSALELRHPRAPRQERGALSKPEDLAVTPSCAMPSNAVADGDLPSVDGVTR